MGTRSDPADGVTFDGLHGAIRRLVDAANEVESLTDGQADAVIGPLDTHPLLLGPAQRAMVRSAAQYRFFLDNVPVAVLELDAEGVVRYANAPARAMLGLSEGELTGTAWQALPLAWTSASDARTSYEQLAGSDPEPVEIAIERADDTLRYVQWHSARPRRSALMDGTLVVMGIDHTDRHDAIVTAVRLSEAREAKSRAEAAIRARREVLAMISHDLRTPLGASMGYAELLEAGVHGPLSEEQLDVVRRMQGTQHRLQRLIEDLTEFARSDASGMDLRATEGAIGPFLEKTRAFLEREARQLNVELVFRVEDPDARMRADFERLGHALTNVCSNSIRFSPQGGTVRVDARMEGRDLLIEVRDDGPDVSAEHIDDVFSTFWTRGKTGGLGLGLSIAARFLRAHGGDLLAADAAGGSDATFRIRVPELPAEEGRGGDANGSQERLDV